MREQFVQVNETTIHYWEWGTPGEPPLLLLHGYLDLAYSWKQIASQLSGYHIIAPDFRGHGDSGWSPNYAYIMFHYITDWFALAEHFGWKTFSLVGHSMGGNCASLMAGTYPERIQRLVLLEAMGVPGITSADAPERLQRHIQQRKKSSPPTIFATREEAAKRLQRHNHRLTTPRALELAEQTTKPHPDGGWIWKFDPQVKLPNPVMYTQEQFHAFWGKIQAPTLQVLGEESGFAAFATPDFWNIPNMRLIRIPEAGHMIHHDTPGPLLDSLRPFLQGEDVGEPWPPLAKTTPSTSSG